VSAAEAPVSASDAVAREARERRWAAPAAAAAGLLALAAFIAQIVLQTSAPLNSVGALLYENDQATPLLAAAVLEALGSLALGAALLYLYRSTRARRPELSPPIKWLALVGAVGFAVTTVLVQGYAARQYGRFVSQGAQTYSEARDALQAKGAFASSELIAANLVSFLTHVLLGLALILLSLNAMRVGLLTRFLGYIGMFAGALTILPIGGQFAIIQAFWLLALAYLFTGRWPSGLPPAWRSGQAEPWPSMQEQREAAARGGADPPGRRGVSAPAPAPAVPSADRPSANAPARPGAARRKRKKRR